MSIILQKWPSSIIKRGSLSQSLTFPFFKIFHDKLAGTLTIKYSIKLEKITSSKKHLGQVNRAQGRPKKTWMEVIRQDIEAKGLSEDILLDRNEWRKQILVPDPA